MPYHLLNSYLTLYCLKEIHDKIHKGNDSMLNTSLISLTAPLIVICILESII